MEKELKIAELAQVWSVSVPTTWNRIKKMGLITFIKKSENNKDVTYVRISDEQVNEFVINNINNVNNVDYNSYYKEMLTDNNINNDVINSEKTIKSNNTDKSVINEIINLNKNYNEELKTLYETFNNRIERLNEELITFKSKVPLLEDKASREGLYIKEINELKKQLITDNNRNKIVITSLLTVLIVLIIVIVGLITWFLTVKNIENTVKEVNFLPQNSLEFVGIKN